MLDIQLLRTQLDSVTTRLTRRGFKFDNALFIALEQKRKQLQSHVETLQAERNQLSKQIGLKRAQTQDTQAEIQQANELALALRNDEAELSSLREELKQFLLLIPNLPQNDVPLGTSEADNQEIRRCGTIPQFAIQPLDHVALGAMLNGALSPELGAKLSGARFTVLRDDVAALHRALAQFMLDTHTRQHGYSECYTPYLVNAETLIGTGQLPKFEQDLFSVAHNDDQLYLIPTAEVTLSNLVRDSIVRAQDLPLKLVAHTPCFRAEAGAYGRDVRGMIRQHQFDKVELVQICHPEQSTTNLEAMVGHAEAILQALELPYRVMLLCSGDMGFSAAKTFDLEVWLPAQNAYREISSLSNCTDFQARRMQARYKD
ncbi:MAG: serine--tRNA ligase, partial [Methylophilaceae bacterium]|nr:serine--tRNA ligase [Methylophilaceae bacterium]